MERSQSKTGVSTEAWRVFWTVATSDSMRRLIYDSINFLFSELAPFCWLEFISLGLLQSTFPTAMFSRLPPFEVLSLVSIIRPIRFKHPTAEQWSQFIRADSKSPSCYYEIWRIWRLNNGDFRVFFFCFLKKTKQKVLKQWSNAHHSRVATRCQTLS